MKTGVREARPRATTAPSSVRQVVQSPGRSLDPGVGSFLSTAFAHDFGRVRIHTDAAAAQSARAVNADAYALGQHVVFAAGRYQPGRAAGIRLLAHELAHTLQDGGTSREEQPIEVSDPTSPIERRAQAATERALSGRPPVPERVSTPMLHRAEAGTYVSTVGPADYLDAGASFYRTWGYPNVRRVSTLDDVVRDLAGKPGPIDKFRLVSHGLGSALEIGLLPEIAPQLVGADAAGFASEGRFRKELLAGPKILDDPTYTTLVKVLQSDGTTKPLMDTLGAPTSVPAVDSSLGILLRAILETHYVANVQLDTGGSPAIKGRGVLDAYNQQRVAAYSAAVIKDAGQPKRTAVTSAIGQLRTEVGGAVSRAKRTFTLTQSDADTLADPFTDPNRAGALRPELATEIKEGAGGPFLARLRSVQAKITKDTLIEVRGCTIGENPAFMDTLRAFFGSAGNLPRMTAPDLYQYFFQLNFETFTANPADEAKLRSEFADPGTGLASGARTGELTRARQLVVVANEKTLAEVATRYSAPPEATLQKLNPTVAATGLAPGTPIWLAAPATRVVPAGPFTSLADVCEKELGSAMIWPAVWALNPAIKDPKKLAPGMSITIPAATASFSELLGTLRGGSAVAVARQDTNNPVVYLDDARRAAELGAWLAKQRWDPNGRTAAALSRVYKKDFGKAARRTFIEFLSREYPRIVDPIFPDDPRYSAHIIGRP